MHFSALPAEASIRQVGHLGKAAVIEDVCIGAIAATF